MRKNTWTISDLHDRGFAETSPGIFTKAKHHPDIKSAIKLKDKKGSARNAGVNKVSEQGWRVIGEKRHYYRSLWEANYARYLQLLKEQGEILDWEHEPTTFWFEDIKRGVRSYLPDFKVYLNSGAIEYVEVKGWMDSKSKTKINRMRIYYPEVKLKLVDGAWFKENNKRLMPIIKDWEK